MSHRRNNSMKYNFNIYGLSGAGTVVDVALVGDPLGGASQVRLRGHVVFRREAGEVQPIVVLPAPNNGKPYSLEQGNPVRFLDKLCDVTPDEMFFFLRGTDGWDLYVEESLAGLSGPVYVRQWGVDSKAISLPLSCNELFGRCYIEAVYTSSVLNLTGGTVVADLAKDAEPLRVQYNSIRARRRKAASESERGLLAQQAKLLRDELKRLCRSWEVRMANECTEG